MQAVKEKQRLPIGQAHMSGSQSGRESSRVTDHLQREALKVQQEQLKQRAESSALKNDIEILTKQRAELTAIVNARNQQLGQVDASEARLQDLAMTTEDIIKRVVAKTEKCAADSKHEAAFFDDVLGMVASMALVEKQCMQNVPRLNIAVKQLKIAEAEAASRHSAAMSERSALEGTLESLHDMERIEKDKVAALQVGLTKGATAARELDVKLERVRIEAEVASKAKIASSTRRSAANLSLATVRHTRATFNTQEAEKAQAEHDAIIALEFELSILKAARAAADADAASAIRSAEDMAAHSRVAADTARSERMLLVKEQEGLTKAQQLAAELQTKRDYFASLASRTDELQAAISSLASRAHDVLEEEKGCTIAAVQAQAQTASLYAQARDAEVRTLLCNTISTAYRTSASAVYSSAMALPVAELGVHASAAASLHDKFTTQSMGMKGDRAMEDVVENLQQLSAFAAQWFTSAPSIVDTAREAHRYSSENSHEMIDNSGNCDAAHRLAVGIRDENVSGYLGIDMLSASRLKAHVTALSNVIVPDAVSLSSIPDVDTLKREAAAAQEKHAAEKKRLAQAQKDVTRAHESVARQREYQQAVAIRTKAEAASLESRARARLSNLLIVGQAKVNETMGKVDAVRAQANQCQANAESIEAQVHQVLALPRAPLVDTYKHTATPFPAHRTKRHAEVDVDEGRSSEDEDDNLPGPLAVQSKGKVAALQPRMSASRPRGRDTQQHGHVLAALTPSLHNRHQDWETASVTGSVASSMFGGISILPSHSLQAEASHPFQSGAGQRRPNPRDIPTSTPRRKSAGGGRAPGDVEDEDETEDRLAAEAQGAVESPLSYNEDEDNFDATMEATRAMPTHRRQQYDTEEDAEEAMQVVYEVKPAPLPVRAMPNRVTPPAPRRGGSSVGMFGTLGGGMFDDMPTPKSVSIKKALIPHAPAPYRVSPLSDFQQNSKPAYPSRLGAGSVGLVKKPGSGQKTDIMFM